MEPPPERTSGWEIATAPEEVHDLLLRSDSLAASAYGLPAPRRDRKNTERLVGSGSVHLFRDGGVAAAMFTLTWNPPFSPVPASFPRVRRAAYLQRLAVRPDRVADTALLGPMCVRKALEEAVGLRAQALRAEANPDLTRVVRLLELLGFRRHGPVLDDGRRRRIHLQHDLGEPLATPAE